jgi:hypothetical protein
MGQHRSWKASTRRRGAKPLYGGLKLGAEQILGLRRSEFSAHKGPMCHGKRGNQNERTQGDRPSRA